MHFAYLFPVLRYFYKSQASEDDVKTFFQSACGEVSLEPGNCYFHLSRKQYEICKCDNNTSSLIQVTRLRLLGDQLHSTRIAFVEFAMVTPQDSVKNSAFVSSFISVNFSNACDSYFY